MTVNYGDISAQGALHGMFSTRNSSGQGLTYGGINSSQNLGVLIHKNADANPSTAGIITVRDFAGITGEHHFTIDTSMDTTFYSPGANFNIIINSVAVDSVNVVAHLGTFSVENRGISAAQMVDLILEEFIAGHQASGTLGAMLSETNSVVTLRLPDILSLANINLQADLALADIGLDNNLVRSGTAQGGSLSSITLDAGASSADNYPGFIGALIILTGGTGGGQHNTITGYAGGSKIAQVDVNWTTTPAGDTTFDILRFGRVDVGGLAGSVLAPVVIKNWANSGGLGADNKVLISSGGIGGPQFLPDALTAAKVASDTANKFADHTIKRDTSNVEASSDGDARQFKSLYGVVAKQTHKVTAGNSLMTIRESDDVTVAGTQEFSSSSAAPITEIV